MQEHKCPNCGHICLYERDVHRCIWCDHVHSSKPEAETVPSQWQTIVHLEASFMAGWRVVSSGDKGLIIYFLPLGLPTQVGSMDDWETSKVIAYNSTPWPYNAKQTDWSFKDAYEHRMRELRGEAA